VSERIALVGLGNMGGSMCRNVLAAGFEAAGYDSSHKALARVAGEGARAASSVAGAIAPPPGPGLGVTPDLDSLEAYRVD
jgi:3-hydroxyisobutyrate dehydrogenase-like beta-hydroxyacid dehydrogenase